MKRLILCLLACLCLLGGCAPRENDTSSQSSSSLPESSSAAVSTPAAPLTAEEINDTYVASYGQLIELAPDWDDPRQLEAESLIAWSFYYTRYPDNISGREQYGTSLFEPPYGYLFSEEEVESVLTAQYGVTAQFLQASPSYIPDKKQYAILVYDKGEKYSTQVTDWHMDGERLIATVQTYLYFPELEPVPLSVKEMTILPLESGFQFLGVKTIQARK